MAPLLPNFCPFCKNIMYITKYYWDWYVCGECFIEYIENNEEKFKYAAGEKYNERDMLDALRKTTEDRATYQKALPSE